jgi:hypothetical protein
MTDILAPKNAKNFHCENCNFICSKKSNYDKHLMTSKHKNTDKILTNTDAENAENASVTNEFICECGNTYKHRQSLFNHKKKCQTLNINNDLNNIDITDSNILVQLIKQNDEFKNLLIEQSKAMIEQGKTIMELSKNSSNTNILHSNINSHNKTFNLQFFLNETCKDAMNIMDFVDSIKLQLCDLENVGKLGFVEGISKIIVSNLNSLDETKRPVHCTDSKREIMYVKDEDKWEKENETKQKMRKVIKHVTHKNSKLLKEFKTKYPGCEKSESRFSTAYDKLIIEAMGGKGDNDLEKEDKIIKNIAKNVIIDKHNGV